MSKRRSRKSFFGRLTQFLSGIAKTVNGWLYAPIKLLFLPLKLIDLFHDRGLDVNERIRSRRGKKERWWLNWLSFPIRLIASPVALIRYTIRHGTQWQLLYFLPAVLAVLLTTFVWYQVFFRSNRVQERYFLGARRAMASGEVTLAKTYFQRLMDREGLSDPQTLQWAFVLEKTGDKDQAESLIAAIAPNSEPGYPPAHAVRAIALATEVENIASNEGQRPSDDLLDRLHFHLSNAGTLDSRVNIAWATYYQYKSDVNKAVEYLTEIAQDSPRFYLSIAKMADAHGLASVTRDALVKARTQFGAKVSNNPDDDIARVFLANTLIQMEEMDEALDVLRKGLSLKPNHPNLSRALADFYIVAFEQDVDLMVSSGDTSALAIALQFEKLKRAILADSNYTLPHVRLVDWIMLALERRSDRFDRSTTDRLPESFDRKSLGKSLAALVTSDAPRPLDHAMLGFLKHKEQNEKQAKWHLTQAFKMDKRFAITGRHLAVAYAYRDELPDVDWAVAIAEKCREQLPENADVNHVVGMVYLKADRTNEGIGLLEESLEKATFPGDIHQALSNAYLTIGKPMKAQYHATQADAMRTKELMSEL